MPMTLSPWRGQKRRSSKRQQLAAQTAALLDASYPTRGGRRRQEAIRLCYALARRHDFRIIVSTPEYKE